MNKIISIHIVRKSKAPAETCEQIVVRKNFGLEGDYRSGKYQNGQITLIESEVLDAVSNTLNCEISPGSSRRQIAVKGLSLNELVGQRLRLGPVLVQVEEKCKPCDNMEITMGQGAKKAMNGKGGVRCRVIKGGKLHINDKVTIESSGCLYCVKLSNLCFKIISYLIKLFEQK